MTSLDDFLGLDTRYLERFFFHPCVMWKGSPPLNANVFFYDDLPIDNIRLLVTLYPDSSDLGIVQDQFVANLPSNAIKL